MCQAFGKQNIEIYLFFKWKFWIAVNKHRHQLFEASLIYLELHNRALLVVWISTALFLNTGEPMTQRGWKVGCLGKNYLPTILLRRNTCHDISRNEGNVMKIVYSLFTLKHHDKHHVDLFTVTSICLLRLFCARKLQKQRKTIVPRYLEAATATHTQRLWNALVITFHQRSAILCSVDM